MTASVTPAAAAISLVVAPLKPFRENTVKGSLEQLRPAVRSGHPGVLRLGFDHDSIISKCLLTCQAIES